MRNEIRTFIFKFYNNTLGYNYTVAKFVANVDPHCTFCTLTQHHELARETPLHLFYECQTTDNIIGAFFRHIRGVQGEVRRTDYFLTFKYENNSKNKVLFILANLCRYYIWEMKLRKTLPDYREMKKFIQMEVASFMSNVNFRTDYRLSQLPGLAAEGWPT